MPYDLIHRSYGICITAPFSCELEYKFQKRINSEHIQRNTLSRQVCQVYTNASRTAASDLNLTIHETVFQYSFMACVHDYETTNNKNVGSIYFESLNHQFSILVRSKLNKYDREIWNLPITVRS